MKIDYKSMALINYNTETRRIWQYKNPNRMAAKMIQDDIKLKKTEEYRRSLNTTPYQIDLTV